MLLKTNSIEKGSVLLRAICEDMTKRQPERSTKYSRKRGGRSLKRWFPCVVVCSGHEEHRERNAGEGSEHMKRQTNTRYLTDSQLENSHETKKLMKRTQPRE